MNFVERFKSRLVVSPTVFVTCEPLRFEVARFSQAEMRAARLKMNENLRKQGLDPDEATEKQRTVALCIELATYIGRHIKGWTSTQEGVDVPAFTRALAEQLVDEMSEAERFSLSVDYMSALANDVLDAGETKDPSGKVIKKNGLSPASGLSSSNGASDTISDHQKQPAPSA